MGYIRKRAGKWSVEVMRSGQRHFQTFATKLAAQEWALAVERGDAVGVASGRTVGELFDRYTKEVVPSRTKGHWEATRLAFYRRQELDGKEVGRWTLSAFDSKALQRLIDARKLEVGTGTLRRDLNLLATVWKHSKDWGPSPVKGKPPESPHRERIATEDERERLLAAISWSPEVEPWTIRERAVLAFLICCECGMRGGELLSVRRDWVSWDARVIRLPEKVGSKTRRRDVAVSQRGMDWLAQVEKLKLDPIMGLTMTQKDSGFRQAREQAGIEGLTFHDSRATFCTWASRRMPVQALARLLGHRDLKMLMRYYRETAEELARLL